MDPELWELLEEGNSQDEVAGIIRLRQLGSVPPQVRVIAQFGEIITVRMRRGSIPAVREDAEVASFKAPGPPMGPEVELDETELLEVLPEVIKPSDERRPASLEATGRGVVIGIVDWGFDFAHSDFRNPDGSTRILALWDQRGKPRPESPQPYGYGIVHTREAINQAFTSSNPYAALGYHPADADLGRGSHGTLVASIAAGNGTGGGPIGIAPEAELVFVHNAMWGQDPSAKLGNSVTLLEAIDFITRTAAERPCAINLSMGRTGEQHDGTTLVEQALDAALRAAPRRVICQSTGNYFTRRLHASGQLRPAEERTLVWEVAKADVTPNEFEVWYPGRDKMEIEIRSPDGSISTRLRQGERAPLNMDGQTIGRAYHRTIEPNNLDNHIVIFLYPDAPAGAWDVTLIATDVVDGRFHAWIERDAGCPNCQSHFRQEDADPTSTTGTICNGLRTIAVGAYNPHHPDQPIASFSSMGPTRDSRLKPDLCAPGVGILGARSASRDANGQTSLLTRMSGTSFAAPHVTGCIALMLQVAPRPLRIEEVHNLLLANTRKVHFPEEIPGRTGGGYLDIERAVEATRNIERLGHGLKLAGEDKQVTEIHDDQEIRNSEFVEGRAEDEEKPKEMASDQNTFYRIASDSNSTSMDSWPGRLNLDDCCAINYIKHQETAVSGVVLESLVENSSSSKEGVAMKIEQEFDEMKVEMEPDQENVREDGIEQSESDAEDLGHLNPVGYIHLSSFIRIPVYPLANTSAFTSISLDEALQFALRQTATNSYITGSLLTGTQYQVFRCNFSALPTSVIEFETSEQIATLVLLGEFVYLPSDPLNTTTRWVKLNRPREFYALADRDRNHQRRQWVDKINRARASIAIPGVIVNEAWLNGRSMPELRLLLAFFARSLFEVRNVNEPSRNFLGAEIRGVTLPVRRLPISEPDCYLAAIASREGLMEDVNAYDLGAGVSPGPTQFNAIGGFLFQFLARVYDADSFLFNQAFSSLNWSMRTHNGHPDLVVNAGAANETVLHGAADNANVRRNVGYLQSGTPGNTAFNQIDAGFRRNLTSAFRTLVTWPHIQEFILEIAAGAELAPALPIIHHPDNHIPPLDPANPDRNTYILKTLLLSAYVRFSACLRPLLRALRHWDNQTDKLSHWRDALNDESIDWGVCNRSRRDRLIQRLTAQESEARRVYETFRRAMSGATAESLVSDTPESLEWAEAYETGEGSAEYQPLNLKEQELDCRCGTRLVELADAAITSGTILPRPSALLEQILSSAGMREARERGVSPAEVFDGFVYPGRDAMRSHLEQYFEIVALPNTRLVGELQPGDLILRRGEGGFGHVALIASPELRRYPELLSNGLTPEIFSTCKYVQVVETGTYPHRLRDAFARRVVDEQDRLNHDTMILRVRDTAGESLFADEQQPTGSPIQPLQQVCGFFGPNVVVTEVELRRTIGANTVAERQNWFNAAGQIIYETQPSQFGLLVSYWLSSFSAIRPTTLQVLQANARSYSNYGPLLNATTSTQVNTAIARVRADLLVGAPDAGNPANLHSLVDEALRGARLSYLDANGGAWSAVFVVACIRGTAIQLGLESMIAGNHSGRDELLTCTSAHRVYVLEAYQRHFGPNPRYGTYHAFRVNERTPKVGDIIVQDRQATSINAVVRFDDIPTTLAGGYNLHGDIVVDVPDGQDFVVTIGGNLGPDRGGSVRRRRYPLDADRHLIVDRVRLYTQERDNGNLPNLPPANNAAGLNGISTGRIFALLSPVEVCAAIPGQRVPGGVLV